MEFDYTLSQIGNNNENDDCSDDDTMSALTPRFEAVYHREIHTRVNDPESISLIPHKQLERNNWAQDAAAYEWLRSESSLEPGGCEAFSCQFLACVLRPFSSSRSFLSSSTKGKRQKLVKCSLLPTIPTLPVLIWSRKKSLRHEKCQSGEWNVVIIFLTVPALAFRRISNIAYLYIFCEANFLWFGWKKGGKAGRHNM